MFKEIETIYDCKKATFELPFAMQSKKRPRVTRNGVYYDNAYKTWSRIAVETLYLQWDGPSINEIKLLSVTFLGGNMRMDGDNCIGAVMDAMVKANIVKNDTVKQIPIGLWCYKPGIKPESIEIVIYFKG